MNRLVWHGNKVTGKINRKVPVIIKRISEHIAEKAKQIVPVKSGKLKASIKATEKGIVVEADYALAVEIGTATKAAHPYVRPAIARFSEQELKQSIK